MATGTDVAWLGLLGLVQLAIPCTLSVICARVLKAPEVSLLALLEIIFGIALAWFGANEQPGPNVLAGGALVLGALATGMSDVVTEVRGRAGLITLNRPKALNALSLGMVRELTMALLAWRDDPAVEVVAIRGTGKEGVFGSFCAGGDIRFFHQAALAGNPQLEDFFTEEY
eukprot:gene15033-19207_t